jgi:hypothetical protein
MEDQISNLILEELRGLRSEVTDGFSELKQRTTAVETHVVPFFENDGGLDKIQQQIDGLSRTKWYAMGGIASMGGLHFLLKRLGL